MHALCVAPCTVPHWATARKSTYDIYVLPLTARLIQASLIMTREKAPPGRSSRGMAISKSPTAKAVGFAAWLCEKVTVADAVGCAVTDFARVTCSEEEYTNRRSAERRDDLGE